jgi:hypothetical protein
LPVFEVICGLIERFGVDDGDDAIRDGILDFGGQVLVDLIVYVSPWCALMGGAVVGCVLAANCFGVFRELFLRGDVVFECGKGGEACRVGWEACLGFSGGFENFASGDVLSMGAKVAWHFDEYFVWGGRFGLEKAKVNGSPAAFHSRSDGASPLVIRRSLVRVVFERHV